MGIRLVIESLRMGKNLLGVNSTHRDMGVLFYLYFSNVIAIFVL